MVSYMAGGGMCLFLLSVVRLRLRLRNLVRVYNTGCSEDTCCATLPSCVMLQSVLRLSPLGLSYRIELNRIECNRGI